MTADITQRREVDEQLRQAQKMEAVGQLTGGIAHDFNNLLMVASSGLDLMDRTKDPDRRKLIRDGVRQAVDRGASLTRQLLTFSRRTALRPEVIDLGRQIGGMRLLLDRSLREDIGVELRIPPNVWSVEVDPSQFELALLNIAVNARDAMSASGLIVISAENLAGLDDGTLQGDFVRIAVTDEGAGMSAETLARVFEPFFTTKEVGKGTGLGLSQAHGFAKASGGAVRIDSTPGAGTAIYLFLPRTTKMPAAEVGRHVIDSPDEPATPAYAGEVLLVEDDDEVAAFTVEMIEHLGFAVTGWPAPRRRSALSPTAARSTSSFRT